MRFYDALIFSDRKEVFGLGGLATLPGSHNCTDHGFPVMTTFFSSNRDIISLVSQVMLIFTAFHLSDALALSTGGFTVCHTSTLCVSVF